MLYPFYRRLGVPRGQSGQTRKISFPLGFDPLILQTLTSRCTDYAIPAPFRRSVQSNFRVILWKFCSFALCDLVSSSNRIDILLSEWCILLRFPCVREAFFFRVVISRCRMGTSAGNAFDYVFTYITRHSL
jgi:hypothetical protein